MKRNCVVNQCCGCCCLCPVRQGASAPYSVWCCASVTGSLGWWVLILRLAIRVGDILSIAQGKGATPAQGTGYVEMLLQVRECAVSRLERLTQIRCNQPRWFESCDLHLVVRRGSVLWVPSPAPCAPQPAALGLCSADAQRCQPLPIRTTLLIMHQL